MSNMSNMSIAELERTGLLYAIPVLPQEIRTGLIVSSPTFASLSQLLSTNVFRLVLPSAAFLFFRLHRFSLISPTQPSRNGLPPDNAAVDKTVRSSAPVQGFFWLVNLFCAGLDFKMVMLTVLDFVHGLGSVVGNQVARNSLYPGSTCYCRGNSTSAWSLCISLLGVRHCMLYLRLTCWSTWVESLGDQKQ